MTATLRQLLIQRAARLQERPALTVSDWGTLSWSAWRNRVEGVAMGLLACPQPAGTPLFLDCPTPWAWASEVAAACCGLGWQAGGTPVPADVLGGATFNAEAGRGPYHDREAEVLPDTAFTDGLTHQAMLARLQTWNRRLGWDHATEIRIPAAEAASPGGRAALWCGLYAGAHTHLVAAEAPARRPWPFKTPDAPPTLDLEPFAAFWSEGFDQPLHR